MYVSGALSRCSCTDRLIQVMADVSPIQQPLSNAVTVSRLKSSAYVEGKKVDGICGDLTQLSRSRKTGCSIVNYLKSQSQHIFPPCSPCDELTDPRAYRPLSAKNMTCC